MTGSIRSSCDGSKIPPYKPVNIAETLAKKAKDVADAALPVIEKVGESSLPSPILPPGVEMSIPFTTPKALAEIPIPPSPFSLPEAAISGLVPSIPIPETAIPVPPSPFSLPEPALIPEAVPVFLPESVISGSRGWASRFSWIRHPLAPLAILAIILVASLIFIIIRKKLLSSKSSEAKLPETAVSEAIAGGSSQSSEPSTLKPANVSPSKTLSEQNERENKELLLAAGFGALAGMGYTAFKRIWNFHGSPASGSSKNETSQSKAEKGMQNKPLLQISPLEHAPSLTGSGQNEVEVSFLDPLTIAPVPMIAKEDAYREPIGPEIENKLLLQTSAMELAASSTNSGQNGLDVSFWKRLSLFWVSKFRKGKPFIDQKSPQQTPIAGFLPNRNEQNHEGDFKSCLPKRLDLEPNIENQNPRADFLENFSNKKNGSSYSHLQKEFWKNTSKRVIAIAFGFFGFLWLSSNFRKRKSEAEVAVTPRKSPPEMDSPSTFQDSSMRYSWKYPTNHPRYLNISELVKDTNMRSSMGVPEKKDRTISMRFIKRMNLPKETKSPSVFEVKSPTYLYASKRQKKVGVRDKLLGNRSSSSSGLVGPSSSILPVKSEVPQVETRGGETPKATGTLGASSRPPGNHYTSRNGRGGNSRESVFQRSVSQQLPSDIDWSGARSRYQDKNPNLSLEGYVSAHYMAFGLSEAKKDRLKQKLYPKIIAAMKEMTGYKLINGYHCVPKKNGVEDNILKRALDLYELERP